MAHITEPVLGNLRTRVNERLFPQTERHPFDKLDLSTMYDNENRELSWLHRTLCYDGSVAALLPIVAAVFNGAMSAFGP